MKRTTPLKAITTALLITLIVALIALKTPLTNTLASTSLPLPQVRVAENLTTASRQLDRETVQSVSNLLADSNLASSIYLINNESPIRISPNQADIKDMAFSKIWKAFPQRGYAVPDWLYTPTKVSELQTDEPYSYLAGKLLLNGLATAPDCPFNGLLPTGFASQCGLEKIRPQVNAWQNQFDEGIYNSAVKNAVPARLLKNIFAQESQFWLGQSDDNQHFGLGQITEGGIDPLFLSYPDYFKLVCTDVLSAETCETKYAELSNQNKALRSEER